MYIFKNAAMLFVVTIGVIFNPIPSYAVTGCTSPENCTLDETSFDTGQAPLPGDLFTLRLTLPLDRDFRVVSVKPSYNSLYPLVMLIGEFGIPVDPLNSNTWSDVVTFDALPGDPPYLVSKLTLYSLDTTTLPVDVSNLINTLANPINSAQQNLILVNENASGIATFLFPSDQVHGGVLLNLTVVSPEVTVPEPATWTLLTLLLFVALLATRAAKLSHT